MTRAPPFRELSILGRQAVERGALDLLEQFAPAQAEMAHGALVHAMHDKRDGLVAFGEREEGLRAQPPENVRLSKSDTGFDLRLALSRQLQLVSGRPDFWFASRIPSTRLSGSLSSLSAAARTGAKTV